MLIERWPYHTHTCLPFQVALHRLLGRCKAHIFDRAHCRRRRREIASPAVSIKVPVRRRRPTERHHNRHGMKPHNMIRQGKEGGWHGMGCTGHRLFKSTQILKESSSCNS